MVPSQDFADTMLQDDFSFSTIISDYKLRYSDGCNVIDIVRGRAPEIAALLISGFGQRVADCCADRGIPNVLFCKTIFSVGTFAGGGHCPCDKQSKMIGLANGFFQPECLLRARSGLRTSAQIRPSGFSRRKVRTLIESTNEEVAERAVSTGLRLKSSEEKLPIEDGQLSSAITVALPGLPWSRLAFLRTPTG